MESFQNLTKQLLKIFLYFLFYSFILALFYYFNLIDNHLCGYLRLIGLVIILYFNSSSFSNRMNTNLLLNGLLLGGSIILILFICSFIFNYQVNLKMLLYYLLILGVSVLGSIKKKKKKKKFGY